MASEIRVNKINSSSGVGTITLSPTGVDISGITTVSTLKVGTGLTASEDGDVFFTGVCTATTFAGAHSGSGANLTSLPAAQLTGSLPAISGANLTGIAATDNVRTGILDVAGVSTFRNTMNVGAAVTISESGIEASGIGITVANINGTQIGGRRNIVMNGKAQVNQRGDSTGKTSGAYYGPDRFETSIYGGTYSISAADSGSTLPEFPKCFRIDCTSAASAASGTDEIKIAYSMEGQDVQHLNYGSSSAKKTTLSFYIRSNKTETYTVWYYRPDGTRQNAVNFSVSSANTWEKKIITLDGDTSSAIANDNTQGMKFEFVLATGSDYTSGSALNGSWATLVNANRYVGNTGTFGESTSDVVDITGIQFEVGSQATAFEHRSFGEELDLCRRYCQVYESVGDYTRFGTTISQSTSSIRTIFYLKKQLRAVPTYSYSGSFQCPGATNFDMANMALESSSTSTDIIVIKQGSMSVNANNAFFLAGNGDTSAKITFDSEL